jgi:hypothetical protein
MNANAYFDSISQELLGLQNRVRNFLSTPHWLTDGEWKESVLRSMLRRHLPQSVQVGRGAVIREEGNSRQMDLLIHSADAPVLFRDGELVFVTPDSVVGVIEVKTSLDNTSFNQAVSQLVDQAKVASYPTRYRKFFGIFAYESTVDSRHALETLRDAAVKPGGATIDLVCLGQDHFIKWWQRDPLNPKRSAERWHSYRFTNKAPGYFIHNVVEAVSPHSVSENESVWFPKEGKEIHCDAQESRQKSEQIDTPDMSSLSVISRHSQKK